jgi:hypothetical protein
MTIHAAKGLEFPVVIVSGLSSRPGGGRGGVDVLWPRAGGYAFRLGEVAADGDFEAAKPIDEQMDHHERIRLLYVACTRARDHLVVSMHRPTATPQSGEGHNAELLARVAPDLAAMRCRFARPVAPVTVPWRAVRWRRRDLRGLVTTRGGGPRHVGATVERSRVEPRGVSGRHRQSRTIGVRGGPSRARQGPARPRPAALEEWRYGTAVGRAVHGRAADRRPGHRRRPRAGRRAQALGRGRPRARARRPETSAGRRSTRTWSDARRHDRTGGRPTSARSGPDGTVLEGYVDLLFPGRRRLARDRRLQGRRGPQWRRSERGRPTTARRWRPTPRRCPERLGEPVRRAVLVFLASRLGGRTTGHLPGPPAIRPAPPRRRRHGGHRRRLRRPGRRPCRPGQGQLSDP